MSEGILNLKYTDERDKSFGLVGMAITLVASDGSDLLARVWLDGDEFSDFELSHDFFFRGNPRMAPKYMWARNVRHLSYAARMILGNTVCREYILRNSHSIPQENRSAIREVLLEVGRDQCSLVDEEIDALFSDSLNFVHRLFTNPGVHSVAVKFSDELCRRRELSGTEIIELLAKLGVR